MTGCGVCELRFEKPIDLSLLGDLAGDLAILEIPNSDVAKQVEIWAKVIKGFTAPVYNQKATALARMFAALNYVVLPGQRAVYEKLICFIQQSGVSDAQSDYNSSVTGAFAISLYQRVLWGDIMDFAADITKYFCGVAKFPSPTLPPN
jgi:hypothetical protein